MNQKETKVLVLIRKKDDSKWYDITLDYTKYLFVEGIVKVTFNTGKEYSFSKDNFFVSKNPINISVNTSLIKSDRQIIGNFSSLLRFDKFYKIFLKSGNSVICPSVEPFDSFNKKDVFGYFHELVEQLAFLSEEDSVERILFNAYSRIETIPTGSVFDQFVTGKYRSSPLNFNDLLFPFPFNISQKKSITNALSSSVSIVQGPPGTGKTQMILNLLANLVYQNKSVIIVSNNNEAIKNIKDKLSRENLGTISALLGKKDNQDLFFEEVIHSDASDFLETFVECPIDSSYKEKVEKIEALYALENEKSNLSRELIEIQNEYEIFCRFYPIDKQFVSNSKIKRKLSSSDYLKLKLIIRSRRQVGFIRRVRVKLKYGLDIKYLMGMEQLLANMLDYYFYNHKIEELTKEIEKINRDLYHSSFEKIKGMIVNESLKVFKSMIFKRAKKYHVSSFTIDNFKNNFAAFLFRFPIILSTSYSILGSLPRDELIDYLIVDESSQSDLLSNALAMMKARNIVVVGDEQQLPAITNQKILDLSIALSKKYQIEEYYQYHTSNLLQAFRLVFPDAPNQLLKEHYRCDPNIIGFCNRHFYRDQLIVMTSPTNDRPLVMIRTVVGNHARKNTEGTGQYNLREIDEIKNFLNNSVDLGSVGIITPFRIQAEKIKEQLGDTLIEVDTVHRFQGREKDTIILSTVVNGLNEDNPSRVDDFINDYHLLNVAVSRAKKQLVVIISSGLFESRKSNLSNLIGYIKYHLSEELIQEGEIVSIFDELYRQETEILQGSGGYSSDKKMFLSEKITADLLAKILDDFPYLNFAMHVTLNKLIKGHVFSKEENKYLFHPWTHVDFLIYNRVSYRPVLVIEVDGIKYHEQSKSQLEKDRLKDMALSKAGIPILRLKTNESKEKEKILNQLTKLVL